MVGEGTILEGKYGVEEKVGVGGFAEVFRARHLRLQFPVAVKVLQSRWCANEACVARFTQEARLCAAVSHPSIVQVHDIGVADGPTPFLVLEYVPGKSLRHHIRKRDVQVGDAARWLLQILDGLAGAHYEGIVHGDLKPSNILVRDDGRRRVTKLIDFGAASPVGEIPGEIVWGTPEYMAPELANGAPATPVADVYSIGVLLFEIIAGRVPFPGKTMAHVLSARARADVPRVVDTRLAPLLRVVQRAMRRDPSDRYRNAGELVDALKAALAELPARVRDEQSGTFRTVQPNGSPSAANSCGHSRPTAPESVKGMQRAIGLAIGAGELYKLPELYIRTSTVLAEAGDMHAAIEEVEEGIAILTSAAAGFENALGLARLYQQSAVLHRRANRHWIAAFRAKEATRLAQLAVSR